jgi:hypothetical protein
MFSMRIFLSHDLDHKFTILPRIRSELFYFLSYFHLFPLALMSITQVMNFFNLKTH